MNYFTFDGIDSRDYNTYIATSNAFDAPGREDEVIKVPGSNNIYYLTEGTYKPFDIKLYCYIPSNMQVKTDDLRNFLLSKGTCTYTEAIRPGEFRVARFIEAYEIDVSDRVSAAFVLTFKAQPQRYLTTNTPITTTATADTTTDTTMSLSTVPTPLNISLNGNTTQAENPTPTNPQVIHNVSGDNVVNVASFNVWDEISFVSSSRIQSQNYIPVLPNTAYYRKSPNNILVTYYNANKEQLSTGTWGTGLFTTPQNCYSIKFMVDPVYGTTYKHDICINVSNAEKNGTYEPYTRQSYPLNLGSIELNKIGSYQDYIYKNGGKWYVHKETAKKTLDGTNETFGGVWGATNNGYAVYKSNMGNRAFSYADKFVYDNVNGYTNMPLYSFGGLSGARVTWTFILPSTVTSLATANTWLQSNNVLLYYPLATQTNTEITDTTLINQLNNIEKAYSYNGTTNILQVSNDNGFMLEVVSLHSSDVSSSYKGEPIITVNGTGLIYFNGCVIKVNQAPMTINSQTMQAYNGTVNLNNYIEANDFPMIEVGNNVIGSEMPLSIVPNYWKL